MKFALLAREDRMSINRSQKSFLSFARMRLLGIGLIIVVPGCKTAAWCATRALHRLPRNADASAPEYWQQCKGQLGSNSEQQAAPESLPEKSAAPKKTPGGNSDEKKTEPKEADVVTLATPQTKILKQPALQLAGWTTPSKISSDEEDTAEDGKEKSLKALVEKNDPDRFQLPPVLPGADTPPLVIPKEARATSDEKVDARKRNMVFDQLYPPLGNVVGIPDASPDAASGVMGLEQLQEIARASHPGVQAAAAGVETARGLMIQAGLPPNPNVGYEADTVRTAFTRGYHGIYIQQTLITARKLGLAAEAAAVDHENAYLNLRRTWYTVISEVRRQYFNTLAARQRLRLAEALLTLSERAYETQIELVKAGEAAAYEPLQLRVLMTQARVTLVQAQQDSLAAWRSLAAAIGTPSLPSSALDGQIDCAVPSIDYDSAVGRMLAVHTDIQVARNTVLKNRLLVTLANRKPIPNINVGVVAQHDYTFKPGTTTYNLVLGGEVPVFDRNQGNRIATKAEFVRATQNVADTSNQLIAEFAPAYATYQANRQLASSFRTDALRDQVRTYRGIYQRYHTDPTGTSFNDIIVAQQTLAATLTQYLTILQAQWQGVVNVGELLQVDDLFQLGPPEDFARIPAIIEPVPAELPVPDAE